MLIQHHIIDGVNDCEVGRAQSGLEVAALAILKRSSVAGGCDLASSYVLVQRSAQTIHNEQEHLVVTGV